MRGLCFVMVIISASVSDHKGDRNITNIYNRQNDRSRGLLHFFSGSIRFANNLKSWRKSFEIFTGCVIDSKPEINGNCVGM